MNPFDIHVFWFFMLGILLAGYAVLDGFDLGVGVLHPFVRGAAVAADRSGAGVGLGLGLAIARRVIEGHSARIRVDDAPGGGAAFSLHLPRSAHASAVR